ncbi:MAG: hypothetical protein ACRENU_07885 [Gemmatimonadaceae bacterium]
MPSNSTPIPSPKRLSKDLAARVLDRAATIDAAEEKVDVATLRAAALDAGISPDAFERALAEASISARESAVPARSRVNGYEVAVTTFWVGLVTGTAAIVLASALLGADKDATAGAVIGGGGALVGTFIHLLRKFRNRNQ